MDSYAISATRPHIEALVAESLERHDGRVKATAPGHWHLSLPGQGRVAASLTIDDDWLVLERTLGAGRRLRLAHTKRWTRRLLDARITLPSGARPVLPTGEVQVQLRAELPIDLCQLRGPAYLSKWIASLCARPPFRPGAGNAVQVDGKAFTDSACKANTVDLLAICEQAGWAALPRGTSGDVVVELPCRDGTACHAIVSTSGKTTWLRVTFVLADGACLAALDIALLRTAGCVRMVRATATQTNEGVDAAVEVCLEGVPEATGICHGLSALAVAHQQIAAEIDALASDELLASAYLTVQGVN